ncbi:hypothetical protein [Janthinobacterium sp. PC23-8]|uniref:hypothetical protein n=1 Tax=Janthinobacterium sp. PC23-8 TaxID=2012679 RepID=UPI00113FCE8F|nr:hypothetical protein [Janthinobacterium sp. PC23-8]
MIDSTQQSQGDDLYFGAMERHPNESSWIGVLLCEYATLEHSVIQVLGIGLGGNLEAAYVICASVHSNDQRIDITAGVVEKSSLSVDMKLQAQNLLSEARAINKFRNILVHGLWGAKETSGEVVLTSKLYSKKIDQKTVTVEDLQKRVAEIRNLNGRFAKTLFPDQIIPA